MNFDVPQNYDFEEVDYLIAKALNTDIPSNLLKEQDADAKLLIERLSEIPSWKYDENMAQAAEEDAMLAHFLYDEEVSTLLQLIDRTTLKIQHPDGYTPLMCLVFNQKINSFQKKLIAERYLSLGGKINECNYLGESSLWLAIKRNDTPMVKFLLENQANPNLTDNYGITPLHIGCYNNQLYHIALLFYYKASLSQTCNLFNLSPQDILLHNNNQSALDLIENCQASLAR